MKPSSIWPPLLGSIAVAIITLGIAMVMTAAVTPEAFGGYYGIWKDNQTFIAAALALVAAYFAARPVYRQMRIQDAQAAISLIPKLETAFAQIRRERGDLPDWQGPLAALDGAGGLPGTFEQMQRAMSYFYHLGPERANAMFNFRPNRDGASAGLARDYVEGLRVVIKAVRAITDISGRIAPPTEGRDLQDYNMIVGTAARDAHRCGEALARALLEEEEAVRRRIIVLQKASGIVGQ